jgi:hypothetical protein
MAKVTVCDDSAAGEHLKYNPNCPFLKIRAVGNVRIGQELTSRRILSKQVDWTQVLKRSDEDSTVCILPYDSPNNSEFRLLYKRIDSFKTWSKDLSHSIDAMALGGYYLQNEKIKCFQCGSMVDDVNRTVHKAWMNSKSALQSVWMSHKHVLQRKQIRCLYMDIIKGSAYVDSKSSEEEKIEPKLDTVPDEVKCTICNESKINTLYVPCSQFGSCALCATQITKCHMCREDIKGYIRVYLP